MVAMLINTGVIKYKPPVDCVRDRMIMTGDQAASCDDQVPSSQASSLSCSVTEASCPGMCPRCMVAREAEWSLVLGQVPTPPAQDLAES